MTAVVIQCQQTPAGLWTRADLLAFLPEEEIIEIPTWNPKQAHAWYRSCFLYLSSSQIPCCFGHTFLFSSSFSFFFFISEETLFQQGLYFSFWISSLCYFQYQFILTTKSVHTLAGASMKLVVWWVTRFLMAFNGLRVVPVDHLGQDDM